MSNRPRPPQAVTVSKGQIRYLYDGGVYSKEEAFSLYKADLAKLR